MEIIVKRYEHFNRALGCHISSKSHYDKVMKQRGFVSFEKGIELANQARKRMEKPTLSYTNMSTQAKELLHSVNKDKKGKVKLSDRQVDGLKQLGCKVEIPKWVNRNTKEGGYATD